jgi:hypothetical protein
MFHSNVIALSGQLASQAPHSMQSSGFATFAFPSIIVKTFGSAGQTSKQSPRPAHFSLSTIGGIPFLH